WALVHYLLGSPRGRSELERFEQEISAGVPLETAREHAFARSFDALGAELGTHISYLRRGVSAGAVLDPSAIAIAKPTRAVPLAPEQTGEVLGDLALALADECFEEDCRDELVGLSRGLLATAVDGGAATTRARAALAYAQALAKDAGDARSGVARALAEAPA